MSFPGVQGGFFFVRTSINLIKIKKMLNVELHKNQGAGEASRRSKQAKKGEIFVKSYKM